MTLCHSLFDRTEFDCHDDAGNGGQGSGKVRAQPVAWGKLQRRRCRGQRASLDGAGRAFQIEARIGVIGQQVRSGSWRIGSGVLCDLEINRAAIASGNGMHLPDADDLVGTVGDEKALVCKAGIRQHRKCDLNRVAFGCSL